MLPWAWLNSEELPFPVPSFTLGKTGLQERIIFSRLLLKQEMLNKSSTLFTFSSSPGRRHELQSAWGKGCPERLLFFRFIPGASKETQQCWDLASLPGKQSTWQTPLHSPDDPMCSKSSRVWRSDVLIDLIIYKGIICKSSDLAPSFFQVQVRDFDLNLCLTHSNSARAQ